MTSRTKHKKIGIALGGGSVWGMAHIGVLKAIEELDIEISCISGTSVGAFLGSLYASHISARQLEKIALSTNWSKISRPQLSLKGLFSLEPMEDFIKKYIYDLYIENLPIPFCAVATDVVSGKELIFDKGYLPTIIRGSCSIPGIFEPVSLDNLLLVDGGVVNNLPVSAVKSLGSDFIIGVNLSTEFNTFRPRNTPELLIKSFLIMQNSNSHKEASKADLVIDINTKKISPADFKYAEELIEIGYRSAMNILSILF